MATETLAPPPADPTAPAHAPHRHTPAQKPFSGAILRQALIHTFTKLTPRQMVKAPILFVVYIGSIWATVLFIRDLPHLSAANNVFSALVVAFVWFVVLFGNFAEALAEGRGKAQAESLRKTRQQTVAHVLAADGTLSDKPSVKLQIGERCLVDTGELIPGDGEVVEGMALVDESAITGESAPVIRESGGDRSSVTGGTRVLSDWIKVRVTSDPGHTFIDRMIRLVEGASRQKTPNEIALNILLAGLTIIFLLAVVTLQPFGHYSGASVSVVILVALLVCLIPTTIGALLSAIGIAGMDRLVQKNVLAMSGR